MAFTGVAALIAAGSEATAVMVMAAAVEVGTALTVVGMVTGNKDLTKIGGAMSLVGGIGGLVAGAGSAAVSSAATAEGVGGAEIGAAPDLLPDAIDAGGGFNPATGAGDAVTADAASGQGIINNAAAAGPDITAPAATAPADPTAATDPTATMGGAPSPTDVATPAGSTGAPGATGDATVFPPSGNQAQQVAQVGDTPAAGGAVQTPASANATPTGVQTPAGNTQPATPAITNPTDARLAAGTQTAPLSSNSFFDSIKTFVQNPANKTTLELGSKLVGGALQGAQQQSQFNQKMDLEKQRLAQTSYGSQVGQNKPRGIIQGARK